MFGIVGRFARKYGFWLLLASALVTAPVALWVLPLHVSMDLATLFPPKDPVVMEFKYFQENFGLMEMVAAIGHEDTPDLEPKMTALALWMRESGYFSSVERMPLPPGMKGMVLTAFPKEPSTNHEFGAKMVGDLKAHIAGMGMRVDLTGGSVIATESIASLNKDVRITTLVSLALVVIIVLMAIRDPIFPICALIPLGMGLIWTLGVAKFAFGEINLMTSSLPGSLLGMGVDYAVYLRNCRREFHTASHDVWHNVFHRIGPPMIIGVLTTAAALFSLCAARGGLGQMGYVGGFGILAVFTLTVLTMPALLDWRDRLGMRFAPPSDAWLGWIARRVVRHRIATITGFGVVTLLLLHQAWGLTFDMKPRSYRDNGIPSLAAFDGFQKEAHISLEPVLLATPDLKTERRVVERLRPLIGTSADRDFGFIDGLSEQLDRPGANPNIKRFRGKDKRFVMMMLPSKDPYEGDNLPELVAATEKIVQENQPDIVGSSGMPLLWQRLMRVSRADMMLTTAVAGGSVLVVLALLMRRLRNVVAAVVPLAGGMIWMLGISHLAGYNFSLISAVAMPLVLGLGIGYGVYIVHRLRLETVEEAVVHVGRSIIVSAATTAAAFFSLCAAHNPAIAGMGLATGTGVTACLLWSLLFLPAWTAERHHRRAKAERTA